MLTTEPIQFKVPESALRPAACPLCGYLLKELPEPRCPECGTRITEGAIVVVGESMSFRLQTRSKQSRAKEAAAFFGAVLFLSLVAIKSQGAACGLMVFLFSLMLVGVVMTVQWLSDYSLGRPPGVVQFSAQGFRIGIGEGAGKLRRWRGRFRWEADCRADTVHLKCVEYLGPLSLSVLYHVNVPMTPEQFEGLRERIDVWNGRPTRYKVIM